MKLCSRSMALVALFSVAGCFDLASLTNGAQKSGGGASDLSPSANDLVTDASDLSVPLDLAELPDLAPPIVHDLSGVCALPADEGKVCDPTTNPCKTPGTCHAGACQPQGNVNAGTVCNKASDACHTDGKCNGSGSCGAQGTRPDGYNYNGSNFLARCCGGHPETVDTAQNCGACGINCNGGSCVTAHGGHLYCTCSSNMQCLLRGPGANTGCCSTYFGNPWVCAAGNCATNQPIPCPGNSMLGTDPNGAGPYYCHY